MFRLILIASLSALVGYTTPTYALSNEQQSALAEIRAGLETITDPVEFAKLYDKLDNLGRNGGLCDIASECYGDVRSLDERWRDRRSAVAKANKKCARYAATISLPNTDRRPDKLVGAPWQCAYIAYGLPEDINTTTTANKVHQQLVFFGGHVYIYVDNGIIVSGVAEPS